MTKNEEFSLYGQYLDGTETELQKAKLARARYLKMKMRDNLSADIGDDPDALTDVLRCVLLCQAINLGIVSDEDIVARHVAYIAEMLAGYGGPAAIMDVLEFDKTKVGQHVLMGYFAAKANLALAETLDDVMMVELP